MKRIKMLAVVIAICFMTSGCSVFMALSGEEDTNLSAIAIGQHRDIVILNLGQPDKTLADGIYRTDSFTISKGNSPSIGRGITHAFLDIVSYGLWEIVGTPAELIGSGEKSSLVITYENDLVTKITTGVPKNNF